MDVMYSSWEEWDGDNYARNFTNSVVYFTLGEVDLDNDYVVRALARTLKDDGVVDSVPEGLEKIESAFVTGGTLLDTYGAKSLYLDPEDDLEEGLAYAATWVEVSLDD